MRNLIILILVFFVLIFFDSCSNSKNQNEIQKNTLLSSGSFSFNHDIDSLLHLFIQKASCHGCYYEMYIDRKDANETLIYLRASLKYPEGIKNNELSNDYLKKRNPLLYMIKDNEPIFIYSGIEDLVITHKFNNKIELHKDTSSYFEYTWIIKKINLEYLVYENSWVNPYEKSEFKGVIKYEIPDSIIGYENDSVQ